MSLLFYMTIVYIIGLKSALCCVQEIGAVLKDLVLPALSNSCHIDDDIHINNIANYF